jgi:hypothetical protein
VAISPRIFTAGFGGAGTGAAALGPPRVVHTENSIRRFPTQGNIVTFRFAFGSGLQFHLLNVADFKDIRAVQQFGEGQRQIVRAIVVNCEQRYTKADESKNPSY